MILDPVLRARDDTPTQKMEKIPVYKTQGIILKKADLSDTDRLLVIYTEKFGKILVRAKGVGKKESKLKSLIEPFNIYELMLARPVRDGASNGARSKNIDVLANSYPIKEFLHLRNNLEALSLVFYFSELVDKLVVAPERDEKIWALLVRAMEFLNSPHPPLKLRGGEGGVNIKTAFEEKLLEFLGYPTFKMRAKLSVREQQNYLASLAGEEIKSERFFRLLNLIS